MENELITLQECCIHYKIEPSFIEELEDLGLIRVFEKENTKYIPFDTLSELESYSRMFYELEINMAGIDAIHNLLDKIRILQEELNEAKNRFRFYE
jgi:hypothetical protein